MIKTLMDKKQTYEWETPTELFNALNKKYNFTLDPACQTWNAKCAKYYTNKDDGLSQNWGGESVFCNPPSGRQLAAWVKKAALEARKKGTTVVMLLPASTDSKWFQEYICEKNGVVVYFLPKRITFENNRIASWNQPKRKMTSPRPSMVVEFTGKRNKFAVKSGKEFIV